MVLVRGIGRAKGGALGARVHQLYPSEFLKFIESEKVPLRWRRIVALAVYLYSRDAEIRALQCRDVDIEHLSTRVTKVLSKRTGEVKATKGRRHRTVTIEDAVVPLLATSKEERKDTGPLVPDMLSERDMARGLRRWLAKRASTATSCTTRRRRRARSAFTICAPPGLRGWLFVATTR
jgi:integrase